MPTTLIPDDLLVQGNLIVGGDVTPAGFGKRVDPDELATREQAIFAIPPTWWRVHDAINTVLPGTSSSDDLALYGAGAFGTNGWTIQTYDVKNAGAVTLRARAAVPLPAMYYAGQAIKIRLKAGMLTTVASVSATIDVEAHVLDEDDTVSADLCTTAAQDINSLTFANKDFTITPTNRLAGEILDVRVSIAINDSGTGTAVIGAFAAAKLLCDIR